MINHNKINQTDNHNSNAHNNNNNNSLTPSNSPSRSERNPYARPLFTLSKPRLERQDNLNKHLRLHIRHVKVGEASCTVSY